MTDPELAEKLSPSTYPYGAKRPCVDTGYYETFNRENVTLVDIVESPPAEAIRPPACAPPPPSTSWT